MAHITITHTHQDGTLLTGSVKGDGVYEIVKKVGFTSRRNRGLCINPSRDHDAKTWIINRAAAALRDNGHEVTVDIDNTPRPTEVVEAERAERAGDRAERYTDRAERADAAGDARLAAARRITDGIPFGQPVQPPGHHSRNAHLNALGRAENHRGKAVEAWKKAEYLGGRASGAAARQRQRTDPRVTMRRIEGLETDKRALERQRDGYERKFRNGSGDVIQVETHEPASPEHADRLNVRITHIDEQITYWRTQLEQQADTGAFIPWGKDHFVKGDRVRHHRFGDWYEVTRVNTKSVSVAGTGWPRTIAWDDVAGRRRDGMQWDTPNGEPWPVELARKVSRWPGIERALHKQEHGGDVVWERIRARSAQRIVLGLKLDAADAEVQACLEGMADVATRRQVTAAFVDVYDQLTAGEKTPDVQAAFTPIVLDASWRMPDAEPQDRCTARGILTHHDFPAVKAGDLIVGWYDRGRSTQLHKTFCGPVAAVSEVNDRRERGEWVTITLVGGAEMVAPTHRWFSVHPAGTWEHNGDSPEQVDGPAPSDTATLWNAYRAAANEADAADGPAPARDDMRPRVETFRGRKLRTGRATEWGRIVTTINGRDAGGAMGSDPAALNRAAEGLRRKVIAADERRITDPDAYPAEWYDGAPDPDPRVVAYMLHRDEQDRADRASVSGGGEAATTPDAEPAAAQPGDVWRGGPTGWFTCTGCHGEKLDPSGGSAQNSDGSQTLCRGCNAERIAQVWDGRPAGTYGVAVNGELVGAVQHEPAGPHPFAPGECDPRRCDTDRCGRAESSPIHTVVDPQVTAEASGCAAEPDVWAPVLDLIEAGR
jgi:hypothetical protein